MTAYQWDRPFSQADVERTRMETTVSVILSFVAENRGWAAFVVFALATVDTTAFLSIFLPSTPLLVGVGALVATGSLDFLPIWVGATTGAMAGSTFSWWVGHRYGEAILGVWPFNTRPELVARSKAAFQRWGVWVILVSHLFSPLTAAVFLIAGVSKIPFWRFQAVNFPSALAWAWLIPKTGEWGGHLASYLWSLFVAS